MANIPLQSITFPDLLNIYNVPTMEGIGKSIFPELIAGGLVDLDSYVENSNPYLFAAMPQGAGKVLADELVGAKVANNQLVRNGNFADGTTNWYKYSSQNPTTTWSVSNGVLTHSITGGTTTHAYYYSIYQNGVVAVGGANHRYLISVDVEPSVATTVRFEMGGGAKYTTPYTLEANKKTRVMCIVDAYTVNRQFLFEPFSAVNQVSAPTMTMKYSNIQVIDLTQMLGSTIADHIYSLEQGTAGAGVAFFTKYFGNGYRPFDSGSLQGALVSGHKTVGVNQWDEEVESGYIQPATGAEASDASKIRMKNYMPVLPNTTYYKKAPTAFWNVYFDANKNYIGYGNAGVNETFTTPPNCYYIRSGFETAYGTTYKNDICINISNADINGQYFPYEEHTYDIEPEDLNGMFKLVDGELKADGDIRRADGSKAVRWAKVTLTNTMVSYASNNPGYSNVSYAAILKPADSYDKNKGTTNAICQGYGWNPAVDDWDNASKIGSFYGGATFGYYWVGFPHGTTLEQMQTALVGKEVVYKLATPTEDTAEPFEEYQRCNPYGTQEYILDEAQVVPIPAGHNTKYFEDPLANIMARLDALENA